MVVKMDEKTIIALRDQDEKYHKLFIELDSLEAKQIKNGYTNPLLVANILSMRCQYLIENRK